MMKHPTTMGSYLCNIAELYLQAPDNANTLLVFGPQDTG